MAKLNMNNSSLAFLDTEFTLKNKTFEIDFHLPTESNSRELYVFITQSTGFKDS